jgi:UDP-glucuronate 4-epimerase
MKILVTGVAGFIGMAAAKRLLERGDEVLGIDNLNDYYDVSLKKDRLKELFQFSNFRFEKIDIFDKEPLLGAAATFEPNRILHLAAQAGVRYSVTHPEAYIDSNLKGFLNILEVCRALKIEHLVYASSSSVYGGNTKLPFDEADSVDHPVSLYAATKKANELMAHTYSHLFKIPTTGLRFFTVYGPWGRPDMSPFLFTDAILKQEPIKVFNGGQMQRDFTYIDDIVEGVIRVIDKPALPNANYLTDNPDSSSSNVPYRIFNIGNSQPVQLLDYIHALEDAWGVTAKKELMPMQIGDVKGTAANTSKLEEWIGFKPNTSLVEGINKFVIWYKKYYQVN